MNIREFSLNLQKLYEEMGEAFSSYQSQTGLHCPSDCGHCCTNPQVEATVLEMIPMALKIFDDGKVEEWLEKLETTEQAHCLMHVPTGPGGRGKCGMYNERPSLCRMFGVAGYFNKHGQVTLSICKTIKELYSHQVSPEGAPVMTRWSARMATLDPRLIQEKIPINEALKKALQKVALHALLQAED